LPFSASRPAAIVACREVFLFSALVVGAIAPDLHYFIGVDHHFQATHTVAGAFYICLPSALAVLWLFQRVLKLPLISLAPEGLQPRLVRFGESFRFGPAKRFGWILISLLLGIFSHLLWDSFTHGRGYMVQHIALLHTMPFAQYGIFRPLYNLLQHLSSLLGLGILMTAYYRWSEKAQAQPVPESLKLSPRIKCISIAAIGAGAAILGMICGFAESRQSTKVTAFFVDGIIWFTTLAIAGLVVFSLYWHKGLRSAPSISQPS
jgi:hypothetical protein